MNDIENDKSEIMRQEVIIGLFFLLLSITSLSCLWDFVSERARRKYIDRGNFSNQYCL